MQEPRDAIIRITSTAICGSDLHLYDGYIPTMEKGDILGHKFMGVVEEVGGQNTLKKGDRVIIRFKSPAGNAISASGWKRLCAIQPTRKAPKR